mgnify:FL=1
MLAIELTSIGYLENQIKTAALQGFYPDMS